MDEDGCQPRSGGSENVSLTCDSEKRVVGIPQTKAIRAELELNLGDAAVPKNKKGAPECSLLIFLFQKLISYLLDPPLISAFSVAPRARAYFLPANRTPVTVALPLE